MGKIQRYFVSLSVNQEIPDDENGHWVKYSDYQKELEAMTADRDRFAKLSEEWALKGVRMSHKIMELSADRDRWKALGGSGKLKNG